MNRKQRNKLIAAAAAAHVITTTNKLCSTIKRIAVKHENSLEKSRKKTRLIRKSSLPKPEKSAWRKIDKNGNESEFLFLLHLQDNHLIH